MNDSTNFDATAMTRLLRVGEVQIAPCGTWAVVAVMRLDENESRYVGDLWRVPLTDANAQPMRLTSGEVSDRSP